MAAEGGTRGHPRGAICRRRRGWFQERAEAERFWSELKERMKKFDLELHPEKTRLLEFGHFATKRRQKRGEGKPETFNFLDLLTYLANPGMERLRCYGKRSESACWRS